MFYHQNNTFFFLEAQALEGSEARIYPKLPPLLLHLFAHQKHSNRCLNNEDLAKQLRHGPKMWGQL